MSDLLNTLPGDIPGLLRHGSPVLWDGEPCLVQCSPDGTYRRVDGDVGGTPDAAKLALDLTDATGRAHAAWAVEDRWGGAVTTREEDQAFVRAERGGALTPEQIDLLARLVLRLAGRTP